MRLTILGSGTLVPDDGRHGSAYLLEGQGFLLLMDCGSGTLHGLDRHGVRWQDLTHVVLSHFHADHVGDIAALLVALKHGALPPRRDRLTILGPRGLEGLLTKLGDAFGTTLLKGGFPLDLIEPGRPGTWSDPVRGLRLATHPTPHTPSSVAWRVEYGDEVIGYTGDTGPHPPLAGFLAGADVLITECSFPDPPPMDTHLTPRGVAALLAGATPRLAFLTHMYPALEPGTAKGLVRKAGYSGRLEEARDGLVVEIGAGEPRLIRP